MGMLGLGLPLEPGGPPGAGRVRMWQDALVETYMPAPSESCSLPSLLGDSGDLHVGRGLRISCPPLYSMGKAGEERKAINKRIGR